MTNAANLGLVPYGGTAIALRLGHRSSVDFDFFSEKPLDRETINAAFPWVAQSTSIQDKENIWSLLVPYGESAHGQVKVSFFGAIGFGRAGEPDLSDDGVLQLAPFDDLMATKVKLVLQRAETKEYRDVAAMIKAGVSLARDTGHPANPMLVTAPCGSTFWDQWVKYFVTRDPQFDSLSLDPENPGAWTSRISTLTGIQDLTSSPA